MVVGAEVILPAWERGGGGLLVGVEAAQAKSCPKCYCDRWR